MTSAYRHSQGALGTLWRMRGAYTKALLIAVCAATVAGAPSTYALEGVQNTDVNEKVDVPTVIEQVTSSVAVGTGANVEWSDKVTVDPGATLTFRVTGTLTSVLDQYLTYHYAFICEHPAVFTVDGDSADVWLLSASGTRELEITDLFDLAANGGSLSATAEDVLKAQGIAKDSKVELTYRAQVSASAAAGAYTNYAHIEYSSIFDPHRVDKSVEDSVTVTVRDQKDEPTEPTEPTEPQEPTTKKPTTKVEPAKKKTLLNMPSTGDFVLAGSISVAAAGAITLLVGLVSRRRKAQE